jgi:regulator of replication initiation timing
MSKFHKQSENMKALEQSLNDHMEICSLERQVKRLNAKNARLKAEVERLRKAGDAMFEALNLNDDVFDNQDKRKAQANWNAAKEGKPSV